MTFSDIVRKANLVNLDGSLVTCRRGEQPASFFRLDQLLDSATSTNSNPAGQT